MAVARQRLRGAAAAVYRSSGLRWALGIFGLSVGMDLLFSCEMKGRGLLSPDGSLHVDAVVIGAACLVIRVAVRFVLPALVAAVLVSLAVRRRAGARSTATSGPDVPSKPDRPGG